MQFLFDELPNEMDLYIASEFLDGKSIINASRVCKRWNYFFSQPNFWLYKIHKEFGIDLNTLYKFNAQAGEAYKKFYYSLLRLKLNSATLPRRLRYYYYDKNKINIVYAGSQDNPELLRSFPIEEQCILFELSLYAGGTKIPQAFYRGNSVDINYLFKLTIASGRLDLVKYVINNFSIPKEEGFLVTAFRSKNPDVTKYLIKKGFSCRLEIYDLNEAAEDGYVDTVIFICNEYKIHPTKQTLHFAASSRNVALLQFLLDPKNNFNLFPDQTALTYSCNDFEFFLYLVDPANGFNLRPAHKDLEEALGYENFKLLRYLLDPKNNFHLLPGKPNIDLSNYTDAELISYLLSLEIDLGFQKILERSLMRGNLKLISYLLDSEMNLKLKIDHLSSPYFCNNVECLKYLLTKINYTNYDFKVGLWLAIRNENIPMVQYLLDPENNFKIRLEKKVVSMLKQVQHPGLLRILTSAVEMQNALEKLQTRDYETFSEFLNRSRDACPSYFIKMLKYLLKDNNPTLNDELKSYLASQVDLDHPMEWYSTELKMGI